MERHSGFLAWLWEAFSPALIWILSEVGHEANYMATTEVKPELPYTLLILVALVQGLALLVLHQSIELEFWPHQEPQWLFAFYVLAFAVPTILLLGLRNEGAVILAKWAFGFGAVLFVLAFYMGSQAIPLEYIRYEFLLIAMIATLAVAVFKALMYFQIFSGRQPLTYSQLFSLSWRNVLTLGLAVVFTLMFWAVLMLWAALFRAIDIDFFYDLFTERWFFYPVLALANGFGVILFRQLSQLIDTIRRILQVLMKFLLLILAFVSIIFLVSLPFTGLAPIWESGGSGLILAMQGLMLFFLNAVYQDDPDVRPYNLWLHRFIYVGMALLPIYSLISFYGLSLRVDQYGWSVARCWAFLLWATFFLFSLGYLWGIIQQRDRWIARLGWVNVRMGLAVLALALLVNSPLLDFRKIAVASQLDRLESGDVALENFDFSYFRNDLIRPGYEALQNMKEGIAADRPEIRVRIDRLYADPANLASGPAFEDFFAAIEVLEGELPEDVARIIYERVGSQSWRFVDALNYYLLPVDMNVAGELDYLLIRTSEYWNAMTLFYREDDNWQQRELRPMNAISEGQATFVEAIRSGNYSVQPQNWNQLIVDDQIYVP